MEGESGDSKNEDFYPEAIVQEDLVLEEAKEEQLLENTAEENLGTINNHDSGNEFEIPLSIIKEKNYNKV